MASRPTLAVTRKSPLKSKKGVKKCTKQPWVETINDLDIYKPSKDMLETKKVQRKSQNKVLAKVAMNDKRRAVDPERQRSVEQQIMLSYQSQPSQNVEAILARSEQVMGICQGIINGGKITPTQLPLPPPAPSEPRLQPEGEGDPEDTSGAATAPSPGNGASSTVEGAASSTAATAGVANSSEASSAAPVEERTPVSPPQYMNSAALSEIAGELLITVRELREELLQEREARERLEQEVVQQRKLLLELCREVVRLQVDCSTDTLQQTRIV